MFGVVISGRPLLTEFQKLSDVQIQFSIPSQPGFSHIVIFVLPGTELPPEAAAAVYIQMPLRPEFELLGALSSEKQSAIFKVRRSETVRGISTMEEGMITDPVPTGNGQSPSDMITLGVSLEPVAQVEANLVAMKARPPSLSAHHALVGLVGQGPTPLDSKILAQRIIANAFNFLASFTNGSDNQVVPLKSFEEWWKKFEKKIELDPGFLDRETG